MVVSKIVLRAALRSGRPLGWPVFAVVLSLATEALATPGGQGGAGGGSGGESAGGAGGAGAAFGGAGPGGAGPGGGAPTDDQDGDLYSVNAGDCDDHDAAIHPNASEQCNEIDDDCDDLIDEDIGMMLYRDDDDDGWGADNSGQTSCFALPGYVQQAGDCRDTSSSIHPDATETCDGTDNDCDGQTDESSCNNNLRAGITPSAELVSGMLLACWLGVSAWRRRRKDRS